MVLLLCCLTMTASVTAPDTETGPLAESNMLLLWPDGAPGAQGDAPEDRPALAVYRPDAGKANGAAIVVCPGGGYGHLAMGHEGRQVGEWLLDNGFTAFILRYRHGPKYLHPAPLQDADRAVRFVRAHAADWALDPDRIGIMGFSAGGHLASTLSTHFSRGKVFSMDPVARASSRPDFAILIYPVISLVMPDSHRGSIRNLLGPEPSLELKRELSNELHVTKKTPPAFLVHTATDKTVSADNSAVYFMALRKAGVPAEAHLFEEGKHGFGLARTYPGVRAWPDLCMTWLERRGILAEK